MIEEGGSEINRLDLRGVLSPTPFPSLAPLPTTIRERIRKLGGGSSGPWRERAQLGPRADLPQSHQSHHSRVRGQRSPRSILSARRARNPASSPTEAPPSGGRGRRSKCKGSRCWSLSFIFGGGEGEEPEVEACLGGP